MQVVISRCTLSCSRFRQEAKNGQHQEESQNRTYEARVPTSQSRALQMFCRSIKNLLGSTSNVAESGLELMFAKTGHNSPELVALVRMPEAVCN